MQKNVLITGAAGLVGSESVKFFCARGYRVFGIDNNMRAQFFGKGASVLWNAHLLKKLYPAYTHVSCDIRNQAKIEDLFRAHRFDLIIHAAAQPSHDWAARDPITDFSINAQATLILLEAFRTYSPEAVFIFSSTNKVYGDRPNTLPLVERKTRYELPTTHKYFNGIDELMSIDMTTHSLMGSSKLSADILVQEYGRYFGLNTGIFRCGCITGPAHSGARLHGFLAYLVRSIARGQPYTIYGYKGKQVRDNIHAFDLVQSFYHFYKRPQKAQVYNMGGSRHSNTSIIEAVAHVETLLGKKAKITMSKISRRGDHMWYISDVSKFQKHYPSWKYTYDNDRILTELVRVGHVS